MNTELTPEKIMEMGRFWDETYLSQFNVKVRELELTPKNIMEIGRLWEKSYLSHIKRLDDLSTEEIERYLQQRKDHLSN